MKSLLLSLLSDPFGLSRCNLKVLLQIVEDDEGESVVEEIEAQLIEKRIQLPGLLCKAATTRFFIKE